MDKLTPDETKVLIKASQIAREKGIPKGASVKEICDKAGISRKTGYQWTNEANASTKNNEDANEKLVLLKVEHQKILKINDDLRVENEGRRLAMEIHGFDEFMKKKLIMKRNKKRKL